jgi:hypothetical protein
MVDPSNGLDFWAIGEYSEANDGNSNSDRWATYWAKVSMAIPNTISITSIANNTLCAQNNGRKERNKSEDIFHKTFVPSYSYEGITNGIIQY